MRTIYLDGQYFKVNTQILEAYAPGSLKAKGVFETMLGLDGVVLDTALHLKRLRAGLKILSIKAPTIDPSILKEVLTANKLSLARVRLMVWQAGRKTHVMVAALPYKIPRKQNYRVCLFKTNRAANARLADVKSLDYGLFARGLCSRPRPKALMRHFCLTPKAIFLKPAGPIFFGSKTKFYIHPHYLQAV